MKQAKGNLWEFPAEVKLITTNGFVKKDGSCVMGRGCALEAKKKFPGIEFRLGKFLQAHGNRCFRLAPDLATFPTKHNWMEQSDIELIKKSCGEIMAMADKFSWVTIVLPRPGCGNGGLKWEDVEPIISELLDDRFTVITFD